MMQNVKLFPAMIHKFQQLLTTIHLSSLEDVERSLAPPGASVTSFTIELCILSLQNM